MYTFLVFLQFLICISVFIYGCVEGQGWYILGSILYYFFYPFIFELLLNIYAQISYNENKYIELHNKKHLVLKNKGHFIYHEKYNITACGIEKLHPFDSTKYRRIYDQLKQNNILQSDLIYKPSMIQRSTFLKFGVSKIYLLSLQFSICIVKVVEVPVCFLPASLLRWRVLDPQLYATQGTIDGACLALEKGWAINLSGGYHHCSKNGGGGFCLYPDISLATDHLLKYHSETIKQVLIVDLDAHQGNGHERDYIGNQNVQIIDFYNHHIYPNDVKAFKGISVDVQVTAWTNDQQYLQQMDDIIPNQIDLFKPDFVLYNAGTDCMEGDPLGNLSISKQGIIERDERMFSYCLNRNIPILMVMSGGYQQENAPVIAKSLQQIYQKYSTKNNQIKNINKII